MNVLVTGANGLLGHHVVMDLLKKHHTVTIIVRNNSKLYFNLHSVKIIEGNFTDYNCLKNAAKGCDAIIHIAAVTSTDLLNFDDYTSINVDATAKIIKVADELKINTIVFVSSANTIGYGTEHLPSDESKPIQFPFTKSFYAQSKLKAEQLMMDASHKPNQHIVIINPTFMIGAYDTKPSSGKLVIMGYKRWLLFVPKGGKNVVAVRNVAEVICNGLTQGQNGHKYLASGINLSFREFYTLQMKVGGYRQLIFEIPDFLLTLIGKIGDLLRFLRIRTELSSMNLRQLMIKEFYNNEKAKAELNLAETELELAIDEALEWFKTHNIIPV